MGIFAKRLGLQQKIWLTYCIMIVDKADHWQRSPEMMGTKTKYPKITEHFSWMNLMIIQQLNQQKMSIEHIESPKYGA